MHKKVTLGAILLTAVGLMEPQTVTAAPLVCGGLELEQAHAVYVRDIGVMGLASHDLFAWDRKKQENRENGRLDLSTLFDSNRRGDLKEAQASVKRRFYQGGNKKNSENAPVYTVTQELIQRYRQLFSAAEAQEVRASAVSAHEHARRALVKEWHQMVKDSYERLTTLRWPEPINTRDAVTHQEQAAMRILHDILPGIITVDGKDFCVTDARYAKTLLSPHDMDQEIKFYDGTYDAEYRDIRIPMLGLFHLSLNLEAIDARFVTWAGLDPIAAAQELKDVGEGRLDMADTMVAPLLTQLFAKAQSPNHTDGRPNVWLTTSAAR